MRWQVGLLLLLISVASMNQNNNEEVLLPIRHLLLKKSKRIIMLKILCYDDIHGKPNKKMFLSLRQKERRTIVVVSRN